jgi:hypothetical protein
MATPRPYLSAETRRQVFERARWLCEYCRSPEGIGTVSFQVEHIFPDGRGGSSELDNLACSCPGCNSHKAVKTRGIDPETQAQATLFNPRTQRWLEHFAWSEDYQEITGLTPMGRATVSALKMNRPGLQNLRRVLHQDGVHPPEEN